MKELKIYEKCLEFMKKDEFVSFGYCWYLNRITKRHDRNFYKASIFKKYCPRLFEYKPEKKDHGTEYWFKTDLKGKKKRMKILEEIILEMKK